MRISEIPDGRTHSILPRFYGRKGPRFEVIESSLIHFRDRPDLLTFREMEILLLLTNNMQAEQEALYRWYLWATIIGVVGGFIGIGIIYWQTTLARKSADAA